MVTCGSLGLSSGFSEVPHIHRGDCMGWLNWQSVGLQDSTTSVTRVRTPPGTPTMSCEFSPQKKIENRVECTSRVSSWLWESTDRSRKQIKTHKRLKRTVLNVDQRKQCAISPSQKCCDDSLLLSKQPSCEYACIRMINVRTHVKEPVVLVRVRWIAATRNDRACTCSIV